MSQSFHFIVIGAGSAGAVIAARLSEDSNCTVALIEAGHRPPDAELMPAACSSLQKNPETDWAYTADPGNAGLGLHGRRMPVPRGKMLGGSSGINYLAYVRGHPGDFDSWAANGASGWSFADVLPYFRKSEGFTPANEIIADPPAHNNYGPLGVSVRSPVLAGAREFVDAAISTGIQRGDYNGRSRGGPNGLVSLFQTTTKAGKRSSTYRAFLEGVAETRPNLTILTGAHAQRIILSDSSSSGEQPIATGVEYRDSSGTLVTLNATKEVILCAGAIGSPQLLMLSGIGPRRELEALGIPCQIDSPHTGKHLKDHVHVPLFFPAPGAGVSVAELAASMGPDALRQPAGPLPADPAHDAELPESLQILKRESQRLVTEWAVTGRGLAASSMYDAAAWFSTGLGDPHTQDAQISCFACGYTEAMWNQLLHIDTARYFDDAATRLAPGQESIIFLANPVQPHSEGEIVLESANPSAHPAIRMNYFTDPHDLKVMVAVMRRALDIAAHWPSHRKIGPLLIPPFLAEKHNHQEGADLSDALLEDLALHFAITVYHPTSTCRIGDVVAARLNVIGAQNLRIADASVMPNITSGNINAVAIMIGEKAAEMIAADHGIMLTSFIGEHQFQPVS